jgi:hypothetical protein
MRLDSTGNRPGAASQGPTRDHASALREGRDVEQDSKRAMPDTPAERVRRMRAARGLHVLLLAGMLWQTTRGCRRLAARDGARHARPAPVPVGVDLLRDPAWRLRLLPGIGPARAWEIVLDRARAPAYRGLEDLDRIPGIGPHTIEKIRGTRALRVLLDGRPVGWAHDAAPPARRDA